MSPFAAYKNHSWKTHFGASLFKKSEKRKVSHTQLSAAYKNK